MGEEGDDAQRGVVIIQRGHQKILEALRRCRCRLPCLGDIAAIPHQYSSQQRISPAAGGSGAGAVIVTVVGAAEAALAA